MPHACVDSLWYADVRPDASEQLEQLLALLGRQLAGQTPLVLDGDGKRALEELAARGCEEERPGAAIIRILAALEQPPLFQRVDEGDHAARGDAHSLPDRVLRDALASRDAPQQGELSGFEPERREQFVKAAGERVPRRRDGEPDRPEGLIRGLARGVHGRGVRQLPGRGSGVVRARWVCGGVQWVCGGVRALIPCLVNSGHETGIIA